MIQLKLPELDYERLRTAGKDLLSLAFMDSRNRTLRWAAAIEETLGADGLRTLTVEAPRHEVDPPLWTLGHLAWFQEYWVARNVHRRRGDRADARAPRLASLLPEADRWFDPTSVARVDRWELAQQLPDAAHLRQYLVEVLETTLELLEGEPEEDDDSLYFHRLAVLHEDRRGGEAFASLAQSIGFAPAAVASATTGLVLRPALLFPATRWRLGHDGPGFAFDNERGAHDVAVPEFEIDAQAVTWSQYSEFVEDGGYDERAHWSPQGWHWVEREGRRTPRHVEQMRHGVLQRRFGRLTRVPGAESAVHLSQHEADAWCRWAGRRLPSEVEWEVAALSGASRGFRWGRVLEWTGTTFRAYPGFIPGPCRSWSQDAFGANKVLRGASLATPSRLVGAKLRRFAPAERDDGFYGFRSCTA